MEEYLDVEIIQKRNEKLKDQHTTLETGIYINGEITEFERKEIFDSFFIMTPIAFTLIPDELADVKYPFVFRPPYILTNNDLTINFNFSKFTNNLQKTTIMETTEEVKKVLENEQDVSNFGEVKSLVNIEGYYFDFRQNVMDGELYHMLANIKLGDNIYQLTFNCLFSIYLDWKPAVLQMWESAEYDKEAKRE